MNRLVLDLLDFTRVRLRTGIPINVRATNMGTVCRSVQEEMQIRHPDRTLHLDLAGELTGRWDPDRLEQVLYNLVENAIVHRKHDTPVRVAAQGTGDALL